MKDLFKHIDARIKAAAPAVRWVDWDLGQLEQDPMPPVSFPCALISFNQPLINLMGSGVEYADTLITLRVAFRVYERTHSKTQTVFRDKALEHLDTLEAMHKALQGSEGECFSKLKRNSFTNVQRADLRVYTLTYSCMYYNQPDATYTPWQDVEGLDGVDLCLDVELDTP